MNHDQDLDRIAEQERRLRFPRFDAATAWALGERLKSLAEARAAAIVIEVKIARRTVFFHAMPATTPANADWARRKLNTVELLDRSSYGAGLAPLRDGQTTAERMGLAARDYAFAGGGFPIAVDGNGIIGAVAISGLPQREDHALVVEALAAMCGIRLTDIALD